MNLLIMLIFALFLFGVYFVPTIIAVARRRHNTLAIFILNFFLGWSLVGWVIALVWSVSSAMPPAEPTARC
jgi:hypothetical protein